MFRRRGMSTAAPSRVRVLAGWLSIGAAALFTGRAAPAWERLFWRSIHLVLVGALVLTLIVVFALLCRWYVNQERRKRGGGRVVLSPTGYPAGYPATGQS